MDFSVAIAACDLKLIELNDDMRVLKVKVILDLGPRSFMKIKLAFLRNRWVIVSQILDESL